MNEVENLVQHTKDVYGWLNKFIEATPQDRWDETPAVIESNVTWQVGHMITSIYFHTIMVIRGHQPDILKTIPLKEYVELFSFNETPQHAAGKTDPTTLKNQLTMMEEKSLHIIGTLSLEELTHPLEPTRTPHPIATIKSESLYWNINHTMYHCGQIGILKRIVSERYDFGLSKAD